MHNHRNAPLQQPGVRLACAASTACAAGLLMASGLLFAGQAGAGDLPAEPKQSQSAPSSEAIRPFKVHISDQALRDLKTRLQATRWPDKETVGDASQGVQLAKLQQLVKHWETDYDWRKLEAKLNALPQFVTTIDGVEVQFIHVRSRHPNALPLILTHGWPGSPLEFIDAIGPLTDPTAFGGRPQDAFDVVIPAIPGHGFSGRPKDLGWGPDRVARAWDVLMHRLNYDRYVAQGGDHGSVISDAMARQKPQGLLGIHLNMPATVPPELVKGIHAGDEPPAGLPEAERTAYQTLSKFFARNAAYGAMMVTRPQTVGYGLNDSPAGLAAFMYEKITEWTYPFGNAEAVLGRDRILDDISLYWLTNTASSSSRFYWENNNNNFSSAAQRTTEITVPVAITVFPGEIYRAPKSWAERAYPSLYYFKEVDRGGHFAAWEQPQLFAQEMRAAFQSLRK